MSLWVALPVKPGHRLDVVVEHNPALAAITGARASPVCPAEIRNRAASMVVPGSARAPCWDEATNWLPPPSSRSSAIDRGITTMCSGQAVPRLAQPSVARIKRGATLLSKSMSAVKGGAGASLSLYSLNAKKGGPVPAGEAFTDMFRATGLPDRRVQRQFGEQVGTAPMRLPFAELLTRSHSGSAKTQGLPKGWGSNVGGRR